MNKVTWFEVPFDNSERCQNFYRNVFGWEFTKVPDQDYFRTIMPNTTQSLRSGDPGTINGGFFKREEKAKHPMIAIEVDSIEKCFKKIEKFGGKPIHPKKPIPEGGFYARFTDTEENTIEIWESSN